MVDIAKVQGLEKAKDEVLKAWHDAGQELSSLTDKYSEANHRFIHLPYKSDEKNDVLEELRAIHTAWSVSYGMTQMCSQLCNRLEDLINAEYEADKEAV